MSLAKILKDEINKNILLDNKDPLVEHIVNQLTCRNTFDLLIEIADIQTDFLGYYEYEPTIAILEAKKILEPLGFNCVVINTNLFVSLK